jgi:hypothetical protein
MLKPIGDVENPIKLGPIYFVLKMKNNYDFSKFVVTFGDMQECPEKVMFESFCRVLEQTYIRNMNELKEEEISVFFSFYQEQKVLIISSDIPKTYFYETYKKIVKLEKKKKLTDLHYSQGINCYFRKYCDDVPSDHNIYDDTYNYSRALYICKKCNILKSYSEGQIKRNLQIDTDSISDEGEELNDYENSSMIDDTEQSKENPEDEFLPFEEEEEEDDDDDDDNLKTKEHIGYTTWKNACIKVLKEKGIPMKVGKIHDEIMSKKYKQPTSTSQATCSSVITESINNGEGIFYRAEVGTYHLLSFLNEEAKQKIMKEYEKEMLKTCETKEEEETPLCKSVEVSINKNDDDDDDDDDDDCGVDCEDINYLNIFINKVLDSCRQSNGKFKIIKKPDQQYVMSLKYFNLDAFFKSKLMFDDNNSFNKNIKEELLDLAETYGLQYTSNKYYDYEYYYFGENQRDMIKCFKKKRKDPIMILTNKNDDEKKKKSKKNGDKYYKHFFERYDVRKRKKLKVSGLTKDEILSMQESVSIYNFNFDILTVDEQLRFKTPIIYVNHLSTLLNKTITNKKVLIKKKKKLFKDMMVSEISKYLSADVLNLLYRTWGGILKERMKIDNERIIKKHIDKNYVVDECEEEGESDVEMVDDILYNEITNILNLYEYIGRDLNLKTNFLSFFLCFFALLSGFISDFNESMINILLLALPGGGKTFVLNIFFNMFKDFVDMFTIIQTNKTSTTKLNKSDLKAKIYLDTPRELINSVDNLRGPGQQLARNNLLNEADGKIQSNEYLDNSKGKDRRTVKTARHNSRPNLMASIKSMAEVDGGARRFYQKILEKGYFSTTDLYLIQKFQEFDPNSKERCKEVSNHFYFLAKTILMYFTIHFTSTLDNKPIESVTDFYGLLLIKKIAEEYERLYSKKIKTDTIKRVRVAARIQCLLRVIQKKFCYSSSKFINEKKIDPFTFYREVQSEAYIKVQDVIFAINLMNDEFYDKTINNFMNAIIKLYNIDKLDDGDDKIFEKEENLSRLFNEYNQQIIGFKVELEGGYGQNKKTYINPNYIVIDTKQSKGEFLHRISSMTNLPENEIKKVLIKLKHDIYEKPYKRVLIEWTEEVKTFSGQMKTRKRKLEMLTKRDFLIEEVQQTQTWFYEDDFKRSYKLVFNINAFKRRSVYTGNQFNIFKKIVESICCYDDCGLDKLLLLNELGEEDCILNVKDIVTTKLEKRKKIWDGIVKDESFKNKFYSLPSEEKRNEYKNEIDAEIRKDIGLNYSINVKNLLNSEQNKFKVDFKVDNLKVSNVMKGILSKKIFYIKTNIGDLNKKLHTKLLSESK